MARNRFATGIIAGCVFATISMVGQAAFSAPSASDTSPRAVTSAHSHAPSTEMSSSSTSLMLPDPSSLKNASATQRETGMNVIMAQLDAFRNGDFAKANAFQSKSLRDSFSSTQQFRLVMTQVYPEFTACKAAEFGDARADKNGHYLLVPVTLTGKDEVTVQALYLLVQESGNYRILTVLGGMNPHHGGTQTPLDAQMA